MTLSPSTSTTLLGRIAAGDGVGFAEFERRYAPMIVTLGQLRRLDDRECAELVQEVLLVFFRKGDRFRFDPKRGKFRTFLGKVVRDAATDIIRRRPDVAFRLLTKRAHRIRACLPPDWGDGWPNVILNVTAENQRRADERLPLLLDVPACHKGVMCAPFIGPVSLAPWLDTGQIEQVVCGGENYGGARPCDWTWVLALRAECVARDIPFCFIETGSVFVKNGRRYHLPDKSLQSEMAWKSGASHPGHPIRWHLTDPLGMDIPPAELHVPLYQPHCLRCARRPICNGCSSCSLCGHKDPPRPLSELLG